jgi:hypothetical protein
VSAPIATILGAAQGRLTREELNSRRLREAADEPAQGAAKPASFSTRHWASSAAKRARTTQPHSRFPGGACVPERCAPVRRWRTQHWSAIELSGKCASGSEKSHQFPSSVRYARRRVAGGPEPGLTREADGCRMPPMIIGGKHCWKHTNVMTAPVELPFGSR